MTSDMLLTRGTVFYALRWCVSSVVRSKVQSIADGVDIETYGQAAISATRLRVASVMSSNSRCIIFALFIVKLTKGWHGSVDMLLKPMH